MNVKEFFENRKCVKLLLELSEDIEEHYEKRGLRRPCVFSLIFKIAAIITYIGTVIVGWIAAFQFFNEGIIGVLMGISIIAIAHIAFIFIVPVLLFYISSLFVAVFEFFALMTPEKHQKKFIVASFFLGSITGIAVILLIALL